MRLFWIAKRARMVKPRSIVKFFSLVTLLSLLFSASVAEDLIFFADDHYKALGGPKIEASAVNCVSPSDPVLRILLANDGLLDELVPISSNGSKEDVSGEMREEMRCTDALNIQATLEGCGPVNVTSGPRSIESLPSGDRAELSFNITLGNGANGWYDLPLILSYEHQVDVSVNGGDVSPLYQPENSTALVRVFVQGEDGSLRVSGTRSDLRPGGSGMIMAVIENAGTEILKNCTARLICVPPFHGDADGCALGEIAPGSPAIASFPARVDENASQESYQLGCEVGFDGGKAILSVPVALSKSVWPLGLSSWQAATAASLVLVASAATILFIRRPRSSRRRRRLG
ncbi:MAG: hypothetical protein A4E48_00569 [Methanosaeta sp. PtaU1.Bin060]|nr:MAG: hypothetical protein A4E48_00569 [Methanosaeta sp. PtaU1.Bin060]